jgi:MFS family permease
MKVPAGHPNVADTSEPCPFLTPRDRDANSKIPPANNGRVPRALSVIVFLDILAVGLVIPLLSKFAKDLGGGAAFTGVLGTAYGAAQLLGASVLGSFSDVHGRRKVYLLSVVGAILGYSLLLAAAAYFQSLALLFASRLPIGLVKQTMTVSQSIICDCTSVGATRSLGLSRLGVAAGLGFIVGPMAGGILSSRSTFLPVQLAIALFLVELAVAYVQLPETSPVSRGYVGGIKAVAAAAAKTAATSGAPALSSTRSTITSTSTSTSSTTSSSSSSSTSDDAAAAASGDSGGSAAAAAAAAAAAGLSPLQDDIAAGGAEEAGDGEQQAGLKFLFKYQAIRDCMCSMFLVDMSYSIMHASFAIYTYEA